MNEMTPSFVLGFTWMQQSFYLSHFCIVSWKYTVCDIYSYTLFSYPTVIIKKEQKYVFYCLAITAHYLEKKSLLVKIRFFFLLGFPFKKRVLKAFLLRIAEMHHVVEKHDRISCRLLGTNLEIKNHVPENSRKWRITWRVRLAR